MSQVIRFPQGIPPQVTVRKPHEQRPARKPSLLERAAACDQRDLAGATVLTALEIENTDLCHEMLGCAERWKRLDAADRLMVLAKWLYSECFEAMDLVEVPAFSTVGD